MEPLVSIIIPVFRTPIQYLRQCLSSVKLQSYPHSRIELVLFDEASPEEYQKELKGLLSEINDIKILHESYPLKRGLRYSRNDAIRISNGEIIFLLDSDDAIHKDTLKKCISAMKRKIDFVYSNHIKLSEDLQTIIHYRDKRLYQKLLEKYKGGPYDPLLHSTFIFHCQMFRREVFEELGGFREDLGDGEEVDFHIRVSELKFYNNFALVPEFLYYYRNNPYGISNQKKSYRSLINNICKILVEAAQRRGMDVIEAKRIGRAYPTNAAHYMLIKSDGDIVKLPYFNYDKLEIEIDKING